MYGFSQNMTQIRYAARVFLLWVGSGHPSVLGHCLIDNLRYHLIKRGILSGAAKQVAQIRSEFEENSAHGKFKAIFFDVDDWNIVQWCVTFARIFNRVDPVRILEVGSWEGRSTLFFLTYFTQSHLTAVDSWDFSGDQDSGDHQYNATLDSLSSEARFDGNLAPYVGRLTKRKGSSLHVLPQLLDEEQKFDVIYVDGSHFADDVLTDGINAWRLLKQGGIMIFDDLLWACYPRARANPAWAINLFLKYHKGEYNVLNAFYQIILQKKRTFTDQRSPDVLDFQAARATATTY
jgi:predicted O-methyltransferase YrrM